MARARKGKVKRGRAVPLPRGTLWLYVQRMKTPMGKDAGTRVYALAAVVMRPFGRSNIVDLRASPIVDWTGALDASQMQKKLEAQGYTIKYV